VQPLTPAITFVGLTLCLVGAGLGGTLVALGVALRFVDPRHLVRGWAVVIAILAAGVALTMAALVALAEPIAELAGV
jgi:hypothetical protein